MDKPENQVKVLNYIRNTGQIPGCGKVINVHDETVRIYIRDEPGFAARVELAKEQHKDGIFDDLQEHWNHHARDYNGAVIERLLTLLMQGEEIVESNAVLVPVKDDNKKHVYDEDGNVVTKVERIYEKRVKKPTPKWVMDIALELMKGEFGKTDMERFAPYILLQFVQFVQREGELGTEKYQEVVKLASHFEEQFRAQMLMITGKTK